MKRAPRVGASSGPTKPHQAMGVLIAKDQSYPDTQSRADQPLCLIKRLIKIGYKNPNLLSRGKLIF